MSGTLIKLKEKIEYLASSEKIVGEYILNNPKQTIQSTVKDIAKAVGSSESAVMRLCKSLGLQGFSSLKSALVDDLSEEKEQIEFEDAMPGDNIQRIANHIGYTNRLAVSDSLSIIDLKTIDRAIGILRSARRIECCGAGGSSVVAFDAYLKFLRVGHWVNWNHDFHMQLTSAALLTNKDVLLAISYSGRTEETCAIAEMAKRNHAKILAITKYGDTPLSELADINLYVSAPESDLRSASTCSRIAELTILDILFTGYISKEYNKVKSSLRKTHHATSLHKIK